MTAKFGLVYDSGVLSLGLKWPVDPTQTEIQWSQTDGARVIWLRVIDMSSVTERSLISHEDLFFYYEFQM